MIAYLACKVCAYCLESTRTNVDALFNGAKKDLHKLRNQEMRKIRGTYRHRRVAADNHEVAAEEKDS